MPDTRKSVANLTPAQNKVAPIIGVVLAGGRSRRFNREEKALQPLSGEPLLKRVIDRARPQVHEVIISTNGDPSRFSEVTDTAVVIDDMKGYQGPLAGLAASFSWLAENRPAIRWMATFPVDGPFFPKNLVASLCEAALPKGVPAFAVSAGRAHPVFCLWPASMESELRRYLSTDRRSRLVDFITALGGIAVAFESRTRDPFFNINTKADLLRAEDLFGEADCQVRGQN